MNPTYEHHFSIRKNSRFPFKHAKTYGELSDVYNWHKNIEILLILGGEGAVRYGASELSANVGDIFAINRDAFHQVKSNTGIDFSYMIIDESFCLENGISTENFLFEQKFRDPHTKSLYFAAAEKIDLLATTPSPLAVAHARSAVLSLLIHLCEQHAESGTLRSKESAVGEEYVKKTVTFLDE
ncbi:MAG: AraC family ligand binding domain-containing protein, partial [Clostridia bacterium]|nr:AraC family ligand binding domain-containing protein [Clostridia bacterium]